ncbi:MAG: RnfABCDGE type electron transport complex subunit D [Firmicutes bacterium]|nr:RnfABCDGE type electron transport complex subunit D [Bacillota bacterium]
MKDRSPSNYYQPPHSRGADTTSSIMRDVLFALTPILIFATVYFGYRALIIVLISCATAVLSEYAWQKLSRKRVSILDCSALLTGLLVAFNLPISVPLWVPAVGAFFAIIIVKQLFGGIGRNLLNPALSAKLMLILVFPALMTEFRINGIPVYTPLYYLSEGQFEMLPSMMSCFLGVVPGDLGETSVLLILLGGIYLAARRVIDLRIPLSYIAVVFVLSYLLKGNGMYEILTGGLIFAAFFMATDYVTTPMTGVGRLVFGVGCGVLTTLLRVYGNYEIAICASILLMNLLTPLIDRFIVPKAFGKIYTNNRLHGTISGD